MKARIKRIYIHSAIAGTFFLFASVLLFAQQPGDLKQTVTPPFSSRFTGPTQHLIYKKDYTTTDVKTSLIWKTCTEGQSGADCRGSRDRKGTGNRFGAMNLDYASSIRTCKALNQSNGGKGYAGRKEWRLPSLHELQSIIDFETEDSVFISIHFPGTVASYYWSSTDSWFVNFSNGFFSDFSLLHEHYIRCVAGPIFDPFPNHFEGPTQHVDYTGDYTTTDNKTGLIWKTCTEGQSGPNCSTSGTKEDSFGALKLNQEAAVEACTALNQLNGGEGYAGLKYWRLPQATELLSIVDYGTSNPAIDRDDFPGTVASAYWSATRVSRTVNAWYVGFSWGAINNFPGGKWYVRCVAGP
jgi:hypothetical protein